MKKSLILISLGLLNFIHGILHIIQFIQSMILVVYSVNTHEHCHDESKIEQIMHHPIFAIVLFIIGILTLIIGINDYKQHRKENYHTHTK